MRMAITQIAHESFYGPPILFQKREASVTPTVSKERNKTNGTRLLTLQIAFHVLEGQLIRAGNADVIETKPASSVHVVVNLDSVSAQRRRIEILTSLLRAIWSKFGRWIGDRAGLGNLREKVSLLLQLVANPACPFNDG